MTGKWRGSDKEEAGYRKTSPEKHLRRQRERLDVSAASFGRKGERKEMMREEGVKKIEEC